MLVVLVFIDTQDGTSCFDNGGFFASDPNQTSHLYVACGT
ncbi:Conserved hypothetical protein [Prochlorococcus marinus str. MIT 9313]|uniref:Uncharacterized protein n=2 Tax=Prochlorococcus marinus TaxID=1219 RepID=B9ERL5_PROMM|nr:Conserved hypothetical protein [Prochlorococcus marinus str. MIT 9303]CAX31963.1 Hypothetical protein PMT_2445 [Prochlorococcus marinus str. MIT 9313]CAX32070.1 Conserved hypothetical protein [Prochlorococcus marinus str. MIT 9313]